MELKDILSSQNSFPLNSSCPLLLQARPVKKKFKNIPKRQELFFHVTPAVFFICQRSVYKLFITFPVHLVKRFNTLVTVGLSEPQAVSGSAQIRRAYGRRAFKGTKRMELQNSAITVKSGKNPKINFFFLFYVK